MYFIRLATDEGISFNFLAKWHFLQYKQSENVPAFARSILPYATASSSAWAIKSATLED